ncbi:TetR/AcrR family transcriptional regulator [Streptomyces sp. NPDC008313]|uniref:TetR/AcrR family transcriptional regulator n=1 Tax=Streptomyces sp. NPDC008313 TaxID=3364826 RepID=UPI0036EA975E
MTVPIPPRAASQEDDVRNCRTELVITRAGERTQLRADAARNRRRLLEVAARLAAECGVANLTMEAVAAGAGVGKGTVFRRFGDRDGLMTALLDHYEQQFQAAFLTGPPPLGPDAPALERLRAFGVAALRHEQAHGDFYLEARVRSSRLYLVPSYNLRLTHVRLLLRGVGAGGDIEVLAHTLLGSLDSTLVHHLVTRGGMSLERVEAAWCDLVDRLAAEAA